MGTQCFDNYILSLKTKRTAHKSWILPGRFAVYSGMSTNSETILCVYRIQQINKYMDVEGNSGKGKNSIKGDREEPCVVRLELKTSVLIHILNSTYIYLLALSVEKA